MSVCEVSAQCERCGRVRVAIVSEDTFARALAGESVAVPAAAAPIVAAYLGRRFTCPPCTIEEQNG